MGLYLRPNKINDALQLLQSGALSIVAGGTDFYPARVGRAIHEDVLDISAIAELRGVADRGDHWRIGATTTWSDLIEADLPPLFAGLKLAAREVGGVQIQNTGTICGNLCNASPAADGVPALLSLDARIELCALDGVQTLALHEFILGNRRTLRNAQQLATALFIPKPQHRAAGHFLKLGARKYLVISIAMVAAVLEVDAGKVAAARVAIGACSAVAQRLTLLESALVGAALNARLGELVQARHLEALQPIDDIRADSSYRQDAALTLARRVLSELGAALA